MKEQLLKTELQPDKPTLLLVDDDPLIAESLSFLLRKHYNVIVADSRSKAFELLSAESRSPDIALIDLGLPPRPINLMKALSWCGNLLPSPVI